MTEVRRADPAARRQAVRFVILGALIGTVLIVGFERYRTPVRDWLLFKPEELAHRVKLVFLLSAVVLSAPLLAFAVYLWSLGPKYCARDSFHRRDIASFATLLSSTAGPQCPEDAASSSWRSA